MDRERPRIEPARVKLLADLDNLVLDIGRGLVRDPNRSPRSQLETSFSIRAITAPDRVERLPRHAMELTELAHIHTSNIHHRYQPPNTHRDLTSHPPSVSHAPRHLSHMSCKNTGPGITPSGGRSGHGGRAWASAELTLIVPPSAQACLPLLALRAGPLGPIARGARRSLRTVSDTGGV